MFSRTPKSRIRPSCRRSSGSNAIPCWIASTGSRKRTGLPSTSIVPWCGLVGAAEHPRDFGAPRSDEARQPEDLAGAELERHVDDARSAADRVRREDRRLRFLGTRRAALLLGRGGRAGDRVDERLLGDVARRTLEGDATVLHHDHTVGEGHDLVEAVRYVDDRVSALAELSGDAVELSDLLDRQRHAGLVEKENASVVVEGTGDHHEPLLDRSQAGERSIGSVRRRGRRAPADTRVQLLARDEHSQAGAGSECRGDVLCDRELGEVAELLVDEGEAEPVGEMRAVADGWGRPSRRSSPASGFSTPAMTLIRLLLPAPFFPTRPTISPVRISKSTPASASTPG